MVVTATPFQRIVDPLIKSDPLTVSINEGPPAVAAVGDIEIHTGKGLLVLVFPPPVGVGSLLQAKNANEIIMAESSLVNFIIALFSVL